MNFYPQPCWQVSHIILNIAMLTVRSIFELTTLKTKPAVHMICEEVLISQWTVGFDLERLDNIKENWTDFKGALILTQNVKKKTQIITFACQYHRRPKAILTNIGFISLPIRKYVTTIAPSVTRHVGHTSYKSVVCSSVEFIHWTTTG